LAALADVETTLLHRIEIGAGSGGATRRASAIGGAPALRAAAAPAIDEPVYDLTATDDIQGNVVPGFNKDHQRFLFLRFERAESARDWVRWLAPRLSTMTEVLNFRREFRAERLRLGVRQPPMTATWTSLAFSHAGLAMLLGPTDADGFGDESFRQGLSARSTYLGDPTDPGDRGHRGNWVVGGPDNEADALVTIAADDPGDLAAAVAELVEAAAASGVVVLFDQRGETLPGNLTGHEHFGFKDGVSQPGVRGGTSSAAADRLAPRYLAEGDPHADLFAKPGQALVWPGQFLLGEPRQDPMDPAAGAPPATTFPDWAKRGSYVVCRRLHQDVPAFWEFAASVADALGTSPVHAASMLVGRWPSGAPLMRSPGADDPALAGDEFANNHFLFDDDTRPSVMEPIEGYDGDHHAAALGDVFGRVCPHAAHIRRMNPRDSGTDFGAPADTLLRLMLRRGIPYGEPIAGVTEPSDELVDADRGLMFVAYMSSIEDQFEFVTRRWANSPVQPNVAGHDPIIGQHGRGDDRNRTVTLPTPDGGFVTLPLEHEWVVPTGGGYFFAPPISAVRDVLSSRVGP
jgi:Dyp-type peroxidase family